MRCANNQITHGRPPQSVRDAGFDSATSHTLECAEDFQPSRRWNLGPNGGWLSPPRGDHREWPLQLSSASRDPVAACEHTANPCELGHGALRATIARALPQPVAVALAAFTVVPEARCPLAGVLAGLDLDEAMGPGSVSSRLY